MNPQLPRARITIPGPYGLAIVLILGIAAVGVISLKLRVQQLEPSPLIQVVHEPDSQVAQQPCQVGEVCTGPTLKAQDPEGDQLTYKFYDLVTGQPVAEYTADSGESVTPEFKFNESGEKQLYMVVEDGAGHTSKDYPIIIPVE